MSDKLDAEGRELAWVWVAVLLLMPACLLLPILGISGILEVLSPVILKYQGLEYVGMCVQYTHPNPIFVYFAVGSAALFLLIACWLRKPSFRLWLATILVGWVLCGPPGWIFVGVNAVNGPEPCDSGDRGYVPGYPSYPFSMR